MIEHPLPDGRRMWLEIKDVKDGRGRVIGSIVAHGGFDGETETLDDVYLDELLTRHPPEL